jgi:hypothetical protein
MDYMRILQFEEWRKKNDYVEGGKNKINIAALDERLTVEVSKVTHDGYFNQRIIGGEPAKAKVLVFT